MIALEQGYLPGIAADVLKGLSCTPRALPPKLFYDAKGSALFEQITCLPEYYPTRTEAAILTANADEICSRLGCSVSVSELGAGTATKTRILLRSLLCRQDCVHYFPLDVSHAALRLAKDELNAEFTSVNVYPHVGDFDNLSFLAGTKSPRLVLYIGSSIGNLEQHEACSLLKGIARQLSAGDHLLIGVDLVKDRDVLLAAYNDHAGVTAEFNKNLLTRINHELGGDFEPTEFQHVALWNEDAARIEMHLESKRMQRVRIKAFGKTLTFAQGERIHTENSYKYTLERLENLLRSSGFEIENTWTDPQCWFAVSLGVVRGN